MQSINYGSRHHKIQLLPTSHILQLLVSHAGRFVDRQVCTRDCCHGRGSTGLFSPDLPEFTMFFFTMSVQLSYSALGYMGQESDLWLHWSLDQMPRAKMQLYLRLRSWLIPLCSAWDERGTEREEIVRLPAHSTLPTRK